MKTAILGLAVLLLACAWGNAAPAAPGGDRSDQAEFISVNGQTFTRSQFYYRLEHVLVGVSLPKGATTAGEYVVRQMIEDALWEQFAKRQGVSPTDEQIDRKMDALRRQAAGNMAGVLRERGTTLDDLREQMAIEQAKVNVITKGIKVTDAEAKKVYGAALKMPSSRYKRPEEVRISAIIVPTKRQALLAGKRLKAGEDFSKVAADLSTDPSGKRSGGQLGWTNRDMPRLPKQVTDAAFSLPVTRFSEPLLVAGKYAIVKCEQKRPGKTTPFSEAKDEIGEQLALQKGLASAAYRKDLKEFIRKSNIVVRSDQYKHVADDIRRVIAGQGTSTDP